MAIERLTPREIASLPAARLAEIVLAFRAALFPNGAADTEWDSETLGELGALCERFGLIPEEGAPDRTLMH
jgi:hypothetical protein